MEDTGSDSRPGDETLTAYDIAIEEVQFASFKLARALLARALKSGDATTTEKECADAHSVYEKMIHLYSRPTLAACRVSNDLARHRMNTVHQRVD